MSAQITITNWLLDIDVDMVLRGQGADPAVVRQRRPRLVEIAGQALEEGVALIEPAVIYRILPVENMRHEIFHLSGGGKLTGATLVQHMVASQKIAFIVCTLGSALERRVSALLPSDPSYAFALDGFGSAALETLGVAICSKLESEFRAEGLFTSVPLNPGILGWPVDVGQPQIFSIIDAAQIGVSLNDSAQMFPHKSTSTILGISPTPFSEGRTCDFCNMRETCRYQNKELYFGKPSTK
jgi:hypothetical protein